MTAIVRMEDPFPCGRKGREYNAVMKREVDELNEAVARHKVEGKTPIHSRPRLQCPTCTDDSLWTALSGRWTPCPSAARVGARGKRSDRQKRTGCAPVQVALAGT